MKAIIGILAIALSGWTIMQAQPRFAVQKDGLRPPGYDQYFTSIMAAVNNALVPGTVIKVFPSTTPYEEKVVIHKDIIVEGSGVESTIISNQNRDFAVEMTAGKLKWCSITSQMNGAKVSNEGVITNCVARECSGYGFELSNGAKILNCVSVNNTGGGFYIASRQNPIVTNCISYNNGWGFGCPNDGTNYNAEYCCAYGNINGNWYKYNLGSNGITKLPSSTDQDPKFQQAGWNISSSSPCKDMGSSAYMDPNNSRSDMGCFGGPEAPTFPEVINPITTLNPDGTITINATGVSRY